MHLEVKFKSDNGLYADVYWSAEDFARTFNIDIDCEPPNIVYSDERVFEDSLREIQAEMGKMDLSLQCISDDATVYRMRMREKWRLVSPPDISFYSKTITYTYRQQGAFEIILDVGSGDRRMLE